MRVVVIAGLVACFAACPDDVVLGGKSCDAAHACITGYACVVDVCLVDDGSNTAEGEGAANGEGEGAEGEGAASSEGEGASSEGEGASSEGEGASAEGEGAASAEGEGAASAEGEGAASAEGEGAASAEGEGASSEGEGTGGEGEGEGEGAVAARSSIVTSAPSVTTCGAVEVTLVARDANGAQVAGGGATAAFSVSGSGAGAFDTVVDVGDGTYRARFVSTRGGSATIHATLDGASVPGTALQIVDVNEPAGLLFRVDAARTGAQCGAPTGSTWIDSVAALTGALEGFSGSFSGSGLADDPFRLSFDGVDDLVDFGAAVPASSFTVAAWVRHTTGGATGNTGTGGIDVEPIVAKGTAEIEETDKDINYLLGLTAAGFVGTDFEEDPDSVNRPLIGTVPVSNGDWHHIVVAHDGATRTIYVDGAVDTTEPNTHVPSNAALSRLCIGTSRRTDLTTRGHFAGDVAVVAVWSRALSDSEVHALCVAESAGFAVSCP